MMVNVSSVIVSSDNYSVPDDQQADELNSTAMLLASQINTWVSMERT